MPKNPPLKMAVIGLGRVGTVHAQAIRDSSRARLEAVCDLDSRRADRAARRFGVSRFLDHQTLKKELHLDAVTIATPNHAHAEIALSAVQAGLHVFCEKPLALELNEASRLVEAARKRGVHLVVDCNRRYGYGYRKAGELIAAERLGKLRHAVVHVTDGLPVRQAAVRKELDLMTLLSHHLDLLRHFFGEFRSVYARGIAPYNEALVQDLVLSLSLARGGIAAVVGGYREGQLRAFERVELVGTRGQIVVDDVTRRVLFTSRDPDHTESFCPSHVEQGDAFYATIGSHLEDFASRLAHGEPPAVTADDALRCLEIAEAATRSLRENRPIEL